MTTEQLQDFFEKNDFQVHLYEQDNNQCAEVEIWTDGGVDMITNLNPFTKEEFIEQVSNFDVDEEIMLHRQDKRYCDAFTISDSLADFSKYETLLKETASKLENI